MEYIRVTEENIEKEHICCAISSNRDVQVVSKKAWLTERFRDGLVFLKSAERVSGGEFCPRDVKQRMVAGKERVNFVWRGKSYTYQANIQANWLDDGIIDYINEIINKAGIKDKKFFGFFDGGQGIVLLYNTFEWVVGLLNAMQ